MSPLLTKISGIAGGYVFVSAVQRLGAKEQRFTTGNSKYTALLQERLIYSTSKVNQL